MTVLYPMLMKPVYKETIWGGNRLKRDYSKTEAPDLTAESWELSAIEESESRIANGIYAGMSINDIAKLGKERFWGNKCNNERFPMLVKLIDANDNLSVQVHPSDEHVLPELGEQGKAEMWYILEAKDDACLYLGFSKRVDRETLRRSCEDGSVLDLLNCVKVSRGDVFFIPPGTVHAIGKGLTLAEIQQSSDTTFRIFDFHRTDANGKPRELHWARAMDVIDCSPLVPERCRANSITLFPEFTLSELFSCKYFRSFQLRVRTSAKLGCDGSSFRNLLCVEGNGVIVHDDIEYPIFLGQSYFLPAGMGQFEIKGSCTLLLSWV